MSTSRGRPPGLAGGIRGLRIFHWASVRSDGYFLVETPAQSVLILLLKEPDVGLLPCSHWSRCAGTGHRSRQTRSGTSRYEALLEYLEGRRLLSVSAAGHVLKGPNTAIVADNNQNQGGAPATLQGDQGGGPSAAHHGVGNLEGQAGGNQGQGAPSSAAQASSPDAQGPQGGNQGQGASSPAAQASSPDAQGPQGGNQGQGASSPAAQQGSS